MTQPGSNSCELPFKAPEEEEAEVTERHWRVFLVEKVVCFWFLFFCFTTEWLWQELSAEHHGSSRVGHTQLISLLAPIGSLSCCYLKQEVEKISSACLNVTDKTLRSITFQVLLPLSTALAPQQTNTRGKSSRFTKRSVRRARFIYFRLIQGWTIQPWPRNTDAGLQFMHVFSTGLNPAFVSYLASITCRIVLRQCNDLTNADFWPVSTL